MALPKRRVSRSRGGKRRSHQALKPVNLSVCPQCREPKIPHRICTNCGTYDGRQVLEVEEA